MDAGKSAYSLSAIATAVGSSQDLMIPAAATDQLE
jgi:hypothetical protein